MEKRAELVTDTPEVFSSDFPELLERHAAHLLASAIHPDVIRERGYRSVLRCGPEIEHPQPGYVNVAQFGFKQSQLLFPAILMPLYGVDGKPVLHQLRPDIPRKNQSTGKPIKYESPARRSMHLDIPPRCRKNIDDPSVPLFITEGLKKSDSLASAGAGCVITLLGVYNWRGTNDKGGKVALPEWEQTALNGRTVYIVFDSDIVDKPMVKQAMERLARFLTSKKAIVKVIRLPPGKDGAKNGVDDFLAGGHTLDDVIGLTGAAAEEAKIKRNIFADLFDIKDTLISVHRYDREGNLLGTLPACNFGAKIVSSIVRDDGLRTAKFYRIIGRRNDDGQLLPAIDVPVEDFQQLNWVEAHWGLKAIISSTPAARPQIVQAIKVNSQDATERFIFMHSGWREFNGQLIYLTNGGAIGGKDISVELDSDLKDYCLPAYEDPLDPTGEVKPLYQDAYHKSLDFLEMGTHRVTMPLWAAMYMAPLNPIIDTCFSLFVTGRSGTFKSSITSLALNHFGEKFAFDHLPGSWNFTDNKLEYLMFLLKDAPMLVDDFAPGADRNKAQELQAKAERVMRDQGNRTGRGRLTRDIIGRITPIPRGFFVTSGEHLPAGMSHNSRIFVVHLTELDINQRRVMQVTDAQKRLYGLAMVQYIGWLARRWDELKKVLPQQQQQWSTQMHSNGRHPRMTASLVKLYAGLAMGLQFMVANKSITRKEAEALMSDGLEIFNTWAQRQAERVESLSPAKRFVEALVTLIHAGRVDFGYTGDEKPYPPKQGMVLVGWRDDEQNYLLNPEMAFSTVREFCARTDEPLTFGGDAVWTDLKERGMTECNKGRNRYNVRIYGQQTWVIKLKKQAVEGFGAESIEETMPIEAKMPVLN